jgi:hypothetical protein
VVRCTTGSRKGTPEKPVIRDDGNNKNNNNNNNNNNV